MADPYVSSLNLFEELENRDTRSVDIYELTEYWNKNGINFEESFTVLKVNDIMELEKVDTVHTLCNSPFAGSTSGK